MKRKMTNWQHQKKAKSYQARKTRDLSKSVQKNQAPELTMWKSILEEIDTVSRKVRKLSKSRKLQRNTETNEKTSSISQKSVLQNNYESLFDEKKSRQFYSKSTCLVPQQCSLPCHDLMKKVERLTQQNEDLRKENQSLGKKLYFEEKQKKQLRWQLEKEKQFRKSNEKSVLDYVFVNPKNDQSYFTGLEDFDREMKKGKNKENYDRTRTNSLSVSQHFGARKQKESQSLLIGSRNEESVLVQKSLNSFNRTEDKTLERKINLEKELEELLQMSYLEKDKGKKNKIRKYMENIAKTIRSIN